jgi:hypothetical protein
VSDVRYRSAEPHDATVIVDFQQAMARETEELELDFATVTKGVAAVFAAPMSLGRYFVAEVDGRIIASLMLTYEWSDWRHPPLRRSPQHPRARGLPPPRHERRALPGVRVDEGVIGRRVRRLACRLEKG